MTDQTNKKIIIALTGEIASGKDATKKYLTEKYGAQSVKFSQILRDVLKRLCLETSRDNLIDLSTILRERFGQDLLAKIIASDASSLDADIVVVDGVRRMEDVSYLSKLPNFKLIRIEADSKIRYERMKIRNENIGDAEKTYEDFMKDHERETEVTIPEVMSKADFALNNDGTFDDLYRQIEELLLKLR